MLSQKHLLTGAANMPQAKEISTTHLPWWRDLSPAARAQLELPDVRTVSQLSPDIVVVGGGVAGLSAAISARATGALVLLLEKLPMLGLGATGRNAGILSAGVNMALADLAPQDPTVCFWPATTQLLLSLVNEAAQPAALLSARLSGAISLATTRNAARHLAQEAHARTAIGLRADLWNREDAQHATGGRLNTTGVVQALWLPDEGRIHPLTLLAHLAQHARSLGVILAGQAEVTAYHEVQRPGGHRWQLALANGLQLEASALIQAVGPTIQANARIYALAFKAELPEDFPLFWDASPFTYADFRPGDGRLTVSGGRYGKAGRSRNDAAYHTRLANAARNWLPELAGQEPAHTWAVDLAITPDMVPHLRTLGEHAPGFAIEGLGALGVLPGMLLGQRAGQQLSPQV